MSEIVNEFADTMQPYTVNFRELPNHWIQPGKNWDFKDADGTGKGSVAVGKYAHGGIAFQQVNYADGVAVTVRYPINQADIPGQFDYAVKTILPGFGAHHGKYKTILGDRGKPQRIIQREACYDTFGKLLDKDGPMAINQTDCAMMGCMLHFGGGKSLAYNINFGMSSLHTPDFYRQSFKDCHGELYLNIYEGFDKDGRIMTVNRDRCFASPEGVLGDSHFPSVDFRDNGDVVIYEGGSNNKFLLCDSPQMIPIPSKDEGCAPF